MPELASLQMHKAHLTNAKNIDSFLEMFVSKMVSVSRSAIRFYSEGGEKFQKNKVAAHEGVCGRTIFLSLSATCLFCGAVGSPAT